jgi:hypothetical protein
VENRFPKKNKRPIFSEKPGKMDLLISYCLGFFLGTGLVCGFFSPPLVLISAK